MLKKQTVSVVTFGCQMNEYDSSKIKGILKNHNFPIIEDYKKADVILINTCAVREKSEHKVFSLIGRLLLIKKKRNLVIGVGGCSAEVSKDYLLKHFPALDIIFTPENYPKIAQFVENALKGQRSIHEIIEDNEEVVVESMFEECGASACISIMKGCDNNCAYCIVPQARGAEISRRPETIFKEIELALKSGVKEIILLGQNVNSYQFKDITFPQLLDEVAKIDGIKRLRFVTSHPKDVSDELIHVIKQNRNICRNIHLPVQSGSDATLKRMNRGYTYGHYREIISKFKAAIPEITFSTDMIVGFPQETEEDFEKTFQAVKDINFEGIYLFKYSVRQGTDAEKMDDDVTPKEKQRRFDLILNYQREMVLKKNKSLEGKIVNVLVTDFSKKDKHKLCGRTENSKAVNFNSNGEVNINDVVDVRILAGFPNSLEGEIVKNN
ncbi:MAG: tRNA (N6-isopentenyl adenosine(37)-C2)-methylthiotransferase MiaB [Nitrospinae bacterium]|nr:tRNA (N6-isopentenyl adenosine(37)-C2)-methylthiotransferase MiaB [Nitrospinota bacterium]